MAKSISPNAISTLLSNPSPDSSSDLPEIVVQILDLKQNGNRYMYFIISSSFFFYFLFFISDL
jgi:replication factor A1